MELKKRTFVVQVFGLGDTIVAQEHIEATSHKEAERIALQDRPNTKAVAHCLKTYLEIVNEASHRKRLVPRE